MRKVIMCMLVVGLMISLAFSQGIDNKPFTVCCSDPVSIADVYIVLPDSIVGTPIVQQFTKLAGTKRDAIMSSFDVVRFCKSADTARIRFDGNAYFLMSHKKGKSISVAELVRSRTNSQIVLNILDKKMILSEVIPFINLVIPKKKIPPSKSK